MNRQRKQHRIQERHRIAARALLMGKSQKEALLLAGYKPSTADHAVLIWAGS